MKLELLKLVLSIKVIVGIILSLPVISVIGSEGEDPVAGGEDPEENCYNLRTRPGLCLHICLLEFDPEDVNKTLEQRHSSSVEMEKMQSTFERLGCFVKSVRNPTDEEALEFLQEGKKFCEELKPSFLVLIISTHGQESTSIRNAKEHPSGVAASRREREHQLFFHNGKTLQTREIVKRFEPPSCKSLADKPRLFFIQACRSIFDDENHENFDRGVMIQLQSSATREKPVEVPRQKHERLQDTADAKVRISEPSEQEQNERVQEVLKWSEEELETKRQILQYIKWLSESNVAKEENPDGRKKLSDALTKKRFSQPKRNKILAASEGYEQDIFDHFFNAIVSEPAPCGNDTLIMFASAPGKEAYNRAKQGGWLITNLEAQIKETMDQNPERVDLLAELTNVSHRMAYEFETETNRQEDRGHKSVPCLYHRFCKDFIVWPEEMKRVKELCEKDDKWMDFFKMKP
ncbi:uncharacterized protein LOC144622174 [Crassostrea virginica]